MPTPTGRESAAERKERTGAEEAATLENISAEQLASMAVVMRIRPRGIGVTFSEDDIPKPEGGLEKGTICSLDLAVDGAMMNVEFPAVAAPQVALKIMEAWRAHQAAIGEEQETEAKVLAATGPEDVKQAAAAAAAAERLRTGEQHG